MNSKRIAILPASTYQIPFVKKAVELGLYVITIDNCSDNPCHLLSHKQYSNVSTTDCEQILEICRKEKINAILSPCSDISLPTVARVSQVMGLSAPEYECVSILTSKILFREFQRLNNLDYPQYQIIEQPEKVNDIKFPIIIKPDISSGSKGIYIIENKEDFISKFIESRNYSLNQKVLIEEEIEGHHLTVEGIMCGGRINKMFISDRITAPRPFVATWGHVMPSIYDERNKKIKELKENIEYIFNKLNYINGPFDADVIISKSSVYIIEITPRIGGNSLTKLIYYTYGFDMVTYGIYYALSSSIKINSYNNPILTKLKLLGSIYPSVIKYNIDDIKSLHINKNIKHISIDYTSGSFIQPFINGRNRAGEVIIQAPTRNEIEEIENLLINSKIKFIRHD